MFRSLPEDLFEKTKVLAANQGLYNGFLAAGLIWSVVIEDEIWSKNIAFFFLMCVWLLLVVMATTLPNLKNILCANFTSHYCFNKFAILTKKSSDYCLSFFCYICFLTNPLNLFENYLKIKLIFQYRNVKFCLPTQKKLPLGTILQNFLKIHSIVMVF